MTARHRGRPPVCPEAVRHRVVELHLAGASLQRISDTMTAEGYPTPTGAGTWSRYVVDRLLHRRHVQRYKEQVLATRAA